MSLVNQLTKTILAFTLFTLYTSAEVGLKTENLEPDFLELQKANTSAVFCKITVFEGEKNISDRFTLPSEVEQKTPTLLEKKPTQTEINSSEQKTSIIKQMLRILTEEHKTPQDDSSSKKQEDNGTPQGLKHTLFIECDLPGESSSKKVQLGGLCEPDYQQLTVKSITHNNTEKKTYESPFVTETEEGSLFFLEQMNHDSNNGLLFDEDKCLLTVKTARLIATLSILFAAVF